MGQREGSKVETRRSWWHLQDLLEVERNNPESLSVSLSCWQISTVWEEFESKPDGKPITLEGRATSIALNMGLVSFWLSVLVESSNCGLLAMPSPNKPLFGSMGGSGQCV